MTTTTNDKPRPEANQSVEHAFAVLRLFADAGEPLGVVDISRRLDLSLGTCHRVLATLCAAGFAQQLHDGGKYVPGHRVRDLPLALYHRFPIRKEATQTLHALTAASGLASTLSVALGNSAVRISGVPDRLVLHRPLSLGMVSELHAPGAPRLLLAFASAERRDEYLQNHVSPPKLRTAIRTELDKIRAAGEATHLADGLRTLALPIRWADGTAIGAITLEGAEAHFERPSARQLKTWKGLVGELERRCQDKPELAHGPFDHLPVASIELTPSSSVGSTQVQALPFYPVRGTLPPHPSRNGQASDG
ncbi:IclR family transcriptional regulator [Streptomyces sp. NPDC059083]|uniref:IclR family transcriptional regulator n=1 Tax=Streptomyces sp. NPDC059083 TaxID=3346721 RepID=UPI0036B98494